MLIKNFSQMTSFDLKTSKLGLLLKLKAHNQILLYNFYNSIDLTEISNVSCMKKVEVETFISLKKKYNQRRALFRLNQI